MTATTVDTVPERPELARPEASADEGRLIDPRGQRFGAALSVALLGLAFVAGLPIVVPLLAVALGVSALFGTRYSVLGRPGPTCAGPCASRRRASWSTSSRPASHRRLVPWG